MKTIELTSFTGPAGWQFSTCPDIDALQDHEVLVEMKALTFDDVLLCLDYCAPLAGTLAWP